MKTLHFLPAILVVMILTLSPIGQTGSSAAERLAGFTLDKSAWERDYEALHKAIPDPAVCQQHNRTLSAHPTLVGSDWDWWNVQYSLEQLRSFGLQPELKTYYVYMSLPRSIQVEMEAPIAYTARVKEDPWPWQEHFEDVVVAAPRATAPATRGAQETTSSSSSTRKPSA